MALLLSCSRAWFRISIRIAACDYIHGKGLGIHSLGFRFFHGLQASVFGFCVSHFRLRMSFFQVACFVFQVACFVFQVACFVLRVSGAGFDDLGRPGARPGERG